MSAFSAIPSDYYILENEYFYAVYDKYPVSQGHALIISKQEKSDFFALNEAERGALSTTIVQLKEKIESRYQPDGYNIGMNCGVTAGQTVMHFHCHLMPRYEGDMNDPRGGVRHCIAGKGYY